MVDTRSLGRVLTDPPWMWPGPSPARHPLDDLPSPIGRETALYVHIPFCPSRCAYCSYASSNQHSEADRDEYLDLLQHDAEYLAQRGLFAGRTASLVHIGGGTPTALSPGQLRRLTRWLGGLLPAEASLEFTCEAHPLTLVGGEGQERLVALKEGGVNRISIGVQDLEPDVLQASGRNHTASQVREALQHARAAGFRNVNLDLIYGLPHQTPDTWLKTLGQIIELSPECITTYHIRLEKGTPMTLRSENDLPDRVTCKWMLQSAIGALRGVGYDHVLRHEFARPGYAYRYEVNRYLPTRDIIGMGVSAYSVLGDRSYHNYPSRDRYDPEVARGQCGVEASWRCDQFDQQARMVVLALRRPSEGLDKAEFRAHFGRNLDHEYGPIIRNLVEHGLVESGTDRLRLTGKGLLSADEVDAICARLWNGPTTAASSLTPRTRPGNRTAPVACEGGATK